MIPKAVFRLQKSKQLAAEKQTQRHEGSRRKMISTNRSELGIISPSIRHVDRVALSPYALVLG